MLTAAAKGPTLSRQVGLDWVVVLVCLIIFPTAQMFFFAFFFLLLFHINTERMEWWRWVQLLSTHWTKVRFGQIVSIDIPTCSTAIQRMQKLVKKAPCSAFKCNNYSTFGEQVVQILNTRGSKVNVSYMYLFLLKRNEKRLQIKSSLGWKRSG